MLYVNTGRAARIQVDTLPHALAEAAEAVWLDLVEPTDQERSEVERTTGLRVPAKAEIAEIESSSRLVSEAQVLYLSTPMTSRDGNGELRVAPLGFVLAPDRLITVRYGEMPVFDLFAQRFAGQHAASAPAAFLGLLEAIVDRLADLLEMVGAELEAISRDIFPSEIAHDKNASRTDARLRATLQSIGRSGEKLSNLRDSLVGVQRIATYVHEAGTGIDRHQLQRCSTMSKDIASLTDYDVQLGNKVQFLLDATLGFINIEQNNGIKVLTVVSVVGVPPTLIASIYGMNFKWIPELQWDYGYLYGLTMIVLSAIMPLFWFRRRGWI